jgi:uncharacterized protein
LSRFADVTVPGGAVPLAARALAPDIARGAMLLLIALANVHLYLYGRPLGVRLYPVPASTADRVVTALQLTLVDGRAYPLFGLLFGYGIGQLAARRVRAGSTVPDVIATVRRRGLWLVAIGAAHVALLWSGDIAAAYGMLAAAFAGLLVAGSAVSLATTAAVGGVLGTLLGAFSGFSPPGSTAPLRSIAIADPAAAVLPRLAEWGGGVLISSLLSVVGMVALGAWAARSRLLDDPARHRPLLVRVAVAGLAAAVLGGLPLALAGAQVWSPGLGSLLLAGLLHTVGGYAGGLGYAAVFGLLAIRASGAGHPGLVLRALGACGQRSLSCYLGQSVLFVALLPAWTLDLGARLGVAQAALLAVAVWLVLLLAADASARAGYRGPAEMLLRRLTYGRVSDLRGDGSSPPAPPSPPAGRSG